MYTYRMTGCAKDNNREYISDYGTYSFKTGFDINDEWKGRISNNPADINVLLNILFDKDCWSIIPKPEPKKMTKADIEKALGYEIDIEDDKPSNNINKYKLSDEQYKDMKKDIKDAFGDFFPWL